MSVVKHLHDLAALIPRKMHPVPLE